MTNITVKVDDDVARWARVEAAKRGTSVSRMLGEMLRESMHRSSAYLSARDEWFSHEPRPLRSGAEPLPSRDELHER